MVTRDVFLVSGFICRCFDEEILIRCRVLLHWVLFLLNWALFLCSYACFSGLQVVQEKSWWEPAPPSHHSFWKKSKGFILKYIYVFFVFILRLCCIIKLEFTWCHVTSHFVQVHNLKKNIGLFSGFVWAENEVGYFLSFSSHLLRVKLIGEVL